MLVACSGGADSLALAAAVAFEAPRAGVAGRRASPSTTACSPARPSGPPAPPRCSRDLGLDPVHVVRVEVGADGGPEAAARTARYAALADGGRAARRPDRARAHPRRPGRDRAAGPGPRLGPAVGRRHGRAPRTTAASPGGGRCSAIRRATTRAACAAQELPVWDDPWNTDPAYTRVRLRAEVLPLLEDVLGGGVAAGAGPDGGAAARRTSTPSTRLAAAELRAPVRATAALAARGTGRAARRAARAGCCAAGCAAGGVPDLQAVHLAAVDALLTRWHGQGPVDLPGGAGVVRASGRLVLRHAGDRRGAPARDRGAASVSRARDRSAGAPRAATTATGPTSTTCC